MPELREALPSPDDLADDAERSIGDLQNALYEMEWRCDFTDPSSPTHFGVEQMNVCGTMPPALRNAIATFEALVPKIRGGNFESARRFQKAFVAIRKVADESMTTLGAAPLEWTSFVQFTKELSDALTGRGLAPLVKPFSWGIVVGVVGTVAVAAVGIFYVAPAVSAWAATRR